MNMLPGLHREALPRHAHVANEIRRRISAGLLTVGDPVPSEAHLCEEFEISRGTVRQALSALRAEGLIGGGQGKPPVVRSTSLSQPFDSFLSFTSWARETGHVPGQRTIEIAWRGADTGAADALGLDVGDKVVDLLRLRTLDGAPAMVERSSFTEEVGRHLFDFDTDEQSIYASLIERGVDLFAGRHTFDAVAASDLDADLLEIPVGAPLLRERRRATTRDGSPLEYADDRYLPHLVSFTVHNTRATGSTTTSATAWQRTLAD